MNKALYGALVLAILSPSIIFAASDWSFGATQASTSSQGGGAGKVSMQDLSMMKECTSTSAMADRCEDRENNKHPDLMKREMGSDAMMGSGTMPRPPKPPMGSGAMMEREMKGLHMAMMQLSPVDHAALVKMIKEYLVSKGIDPAKYAEMRDEMKDMRQTNRDEMKDMRQTNRDEMRAKRDEMRAKIKNTQGKPQQASYDIKMMK